MTRQGHRNIVYRAMAVDGHYHVYSTAVDNSYTADTIPAQLYC